MAKRCRLEIMAEILSFCERPQAKTRVMYKINLSFTLARDCLSELQSRELLEVHHSSAKYITTRKGLKFLEEWKKLLELSSGPL